MSSREQYAREQARLDAISQKVDAYGAARAGAEESPPLEAYEGEPAARGGHAEAASANLFGELEQFLGRFIAYPSEHARLAHALWLVHTHAMAAWESTPRLAFLSPEPGSGKTRALEVSELLVPRPVEAINTTPAYLFRKVADPDGLPTILYDEIDTLFGPKAKENEEIRGILNAGHRRGAIAGRCVVKGKTVLTEELPAYCAVALAGLGNLPDTILTRSVVVRMRRRAPTEPIEPYRRREHAPQGERLRERLAEWTSARVDELTAARPAMPEGVADRAADVWEPLLAVADAVGADFPARSRAAAVALINDARANAASLGVRLLTDLKAVFGAKDTMPTVEILAALVTLEDSPWADLKGHALEARTLSRMLSKYEVKRAQFRHAGVGGVKGYRRVDLQDAWDRYVLVADGVADVAVVADTYPATPTDLKGIKRGVEREGPALGEATYEPATSATSVTGCPRCAGEGCKWCRP